MVGHECHDIGLIVNDQDARAGSARFCHDVKFVGILLTASTCAVSRSRDDGGQLPVHRTSNYLAPQTLPSLLRMKFSVSLCCLAVLGCASVRVPRGTAPVDLVIASTTDVHG